MNSNLIAVALCLFLCALVLARSRSQRHSDDRRSAGVVTREVLMCEKRRRLLALMQAAFPSHAVMCSVPASQVVSLRGGSRLALKRDALRRCILDFVIVDASGEACYVFTIGKSIAMPGGYSDDAYVARALKRAGISLFRISRLSSQLTVARLQQVVGCDEEARWVESLKGQISPEAR